MKTYLLLCTALLCLLLALAGCGNGEEQSAKGAETITVTDSIGREVTVP